jgi:hypothetical protein
MAINQRIFQQGDGLDTLRDLVEIVKNPKLIEAAHDTHRKQLALTVDEQARVEEAKGFIAKHRDLDKGLRDREEALIIAQQEHATALENFNTHRTNETARIEDASNAIVEKSKDQAAVDVKHAQERTEIERNRKDVENRAAQISAEYRSKAEELERRENALLVGQTQLTDAKTDLNIKAQKLKEAASF